MKTILRLVTASPRANAWSATILIRIIVGIIFIHAGYRKFAEPQEMGTGRFEDLGFAAPAFWSALVGTFELLGGLFVLVGLLTRAAAIPLVVTMVMALLLTKVPQFPEEGFIAAFHAARLDLALLLASLYLVIAGGGRLALDRRLHPA